MKLVKLSYIDANWELRDLELDSVNLIVARNATGKSRTLLAIDYLVKVINQKRDFDRSCSFDIIFHDAENNIINYSFSIEFTLTQFEFNVTKEHLVVNGNEMLIRDGAISKINNKLTSEFDKGYPPLNKLTLHTSRDVKKYPFLESLCVWAESAYGFKFGSIIPFSTKDKLFAFLTPVDNIPLLFNLLDEPSKKTVISEFNSTGYQVSEISFEDKADTGILYITENGIDAPLSHFVLAQGMFRTLSMIIYLEYLLSKKRPAMVIIDDLCEGLDYDRATKLGKLVFDKCVNTNIQLVATSNDSFLMEVVDIKYWNVLQRNGKVVTTLNVKNHPKLFEDFRFTGLSNFDFFSSDFINQELAS